MKRLALIGALALTTGCINPTAPSCDVETVQHHNIPATMPDGHVVWMCETQPRGYSAGLERDHYISSTPCPAEPIK